MSDNRVNLTYKIPKPKNYKYLHFFCCCHVLVNNNNNNNNNNIYSPQSGRKHIMHYT